MGARYTPAVLAIVSIFAVSNGAAHGDLVAHWAFETTDTGGATTPNAGSGGQRLVGKLVRDAHLETLVSDGRVTRTSVLALDGDGDWVQIDHEVTVFGDGNSFTIAAWIKTNTKSVAILGKGNADGVFQKVA